MDPNRRNVLKIDDVAVTWAQVLEDSASKLVVVDLHQEWCGPCDALGPTLQRLYMDYDNADSRLVLASAAYTSDQTPGATATTSPLSSLGAKIQAAIPPELKINLETNGCMPLFALIRNKAIVALTVGVDAPTLMQQVGLNIPAYKPPEEDA